MNRRIKTLCLGLIALLTGWQPVSAQTSCYFPGDTSRWDSRFAMPGITTGTVYSLIPSQDGTLLIGTSATSRFGGDLNMGSIARWDGARYRPLGEGLYGAPGSMTIYAMIEDAAGNVYVGGNFNGATNPGSGVVNSKGIIKWNVATQQWEALGLGLAGGQVYALALDGDTLYVGGTFTQSEGSTPVSMNKVGRWRIDTGTWEALGTGVGSTTAGLNGQVHALTLDNSGALIVGGAINQAGGQPVNSIARWTPGSGWDNMGGGLTSFAIDANGQPTGVSFPSTVQSLAYNPVTGDLYAGGYFGEYIGSAGIAQTKGLAVWDGSGWSLIPGIGIPFNASNFAVHSLHLDLAANRLYVGGTFFQYVATNPANSPEGNGVMALNLGTGTWDDLQGGIQQGASAGGTVYALTTWQGRLFAGGSFARRQPAGDFANNLLAYDGSHWDNLGDGINENGGTLYDAVPYGDDLIVCGTFSKVDDVEIPRLATWNATTGWDTLVTGFFGNFSSNFNTLIYDLLVDGPNLYLGGQFGGVGNITSTGLLRYNLVSGQWTSWGSGLGGFNVPRVHDFEKFQGEVYVAGYFTQINGATATYLAKLTGSGWVSVGTFNGRVYELANAGDSLLYAVGDFTQVDGNTNAVRAARYDGTSWSALGQGIISGQVYTVGVDPLTGAAYLGGTFSSVRQANGNTLSVARLVRWENGQWSAVGNFTNEPSFTRINHLTFDAAGTLYLTGGFVQAGGETVNHLMRWNPAFGIAGFGLGLNHDAPTPGVPGEKIVLVDSALYALGSFYRAGINQSVQIARYQLDDPAAGAIVVDLGADTTACGSLTLDAGVNDVAYIWNTGAQTRTLTVTATGWYSVTAFNGDCADEDSIFVTVVPVSPVFTADTVSGCDELTVDAGAGYTSYAWNTGDTTQTTLVNDNDILTVTVTDVNGCVITDTIFAEITGYSPTATFTAAPDDDDQVAFDAGGSFGGETYSWDFGDGTTGSGAQVVHTYAQNDTFLVTLIVGNACGTDTFQQVVIVDFLTSLGGGQVVAGLQLFPNPARETATLRGTLAGQQATLALRDLQGRLLRTQVVSLTGGQLDTQLDLRGLAPGWYLVQVTGAGGTGYLRLSVH